MKPKPIQPDAITTADPGRKSTPQELARTPQHVQSIQVDVPKPGTAELGRTRTAERVQRPDAVTHVPRAARPTGPRLKGVQLGLPIEPEPEPEPLPPPPLSNVTGTEESDRAAAVIYPGIGDSVQIDVDRVARMKRTDHHQWLIDHGLHAAYGLVVGTEVTGSVYMLIVDTGSFRVAVDASICTQQPLPSQPQAMQEPRLSPERMRKHSDGSYNLT